MKPVNKSTSPFYFWNGLVEKPLRKLLILPAAPGAANHKSSTSRSFINSHAKDIEGDEYSLGLVPNSLLHVPTCVSLFTAGVLEHLERFHEVNSSPAKLTFFQLLFR